jgi:FtsH-binding integral membrane protein
MNNFMMGVGWVLGICWAAFTFGAALTFVRDTFGEPRMALYIVVSGVALAVGLIVRHEKRNERE